MTSNTISFEFDDLQLVAPTEGLPPGNYGVIGKVDIEGEHRISADPQERWFECKFSDWTLTVIPHIDTDTEIKFTDDEADTVAKALDLDDRLIYKVEDEGWLA